MGKLVTFGLVVALLQLLVCAAGIVVGLLVGPNDWIGSPWYFLGYAVSLLSIIIPALLWLTLRRGGFYRQWKADYAERVAEADRASGQPGAPTP